MAGETPDRYAQAARIHALLAPELAAEGWDLVDVRIFRGGGRLQVRLYVDLPGEGRIDLDGCASASRTASMFLEEADLFEGAWVLEVSSPGIRRPLRRPEHFAAVQGRDVTVKYRPAGQEKAVQVRGELARADGEELVIQPAPRQDAPPEEPPPPPLTLAVPEVLEANLEREIDVQAVIRQDRRRKKEARQQKRQARKARRGGRRRSGGPDADEDQERDG